MTSIRAEEIRRSRLPRVANGIQISPQVRRALDDPQPLTILRSARGFGKTSVLISWLRTSQDTTPVIYHALDSSAHDQDGFWADLAGVLAAAGVPGLAGQGDSRLRVIDAIAALSSPLRLVLDNLHEAGSEQGATAIDDDLVEMVRSNDQFYLVVATRTLRALESTGSLSVDAAVIGPEELKFTAPRVMALAEVMGVEISPAYARRIADDLGGWPAAIRAGLRNPTEGASVDENNVAGYLATVLRDMRIGAIRSFFLRSAVPEEFDSAVAAAILPEDQGGLALGRIRAAGLLREHTDEHGVVTYSYPPVIRRALLRVLHETEPELERQVHLALMSSAAERHDPVGVVRHAVDAAEWTTVTEVIERHWAQLLTTAPQVVVNAARAVPVEIGDRDPRLRVARKHVAAIAGATGIRTSPWPVLEHPTMAAEINARIAQSDQPVDEEAVALVLWGAACAMGGNHDAGIYAFNQARTRGLGANQGAVAVIGTIGLAIVHALNGEPELAKRWLEDSELGSDLFDAPDPQAKDVVTSAAWIARALIAVDQVSPDAAQIVSEMIDPRHRGDVWAMGVFARAHYAGVGDDPEAVFRQANQVRAALRHIAAGTLAESVLTSSLVELLLFARMSGIAQEAAEQLSDDPIGWTTHAKVRLARHEFAEAVRFAGKAVAASGISQRSYLESQVILAASYHALDDQKRAREAFAAATSTAQATGQRRPFYLMHRYVFDLLAGENTAVLGLWPRASVTSTTRTVEEDIDLPTLTMREAQVLRALERHAGPVGIANSLDLSVNTVKTHLRTIYRKFGVSSRNEALEIVGRTGLNVANRP